MELIIDEDMALYESGYKTWGTINALNQYVSPSRKLAKKTSRHTQPVLGDQVVNHIPLPAIRERCLDKRLNKPRVQIQVCRVDDLFQEVIRLLQFIPAVYT